MVPALPPVLPTANIRHSASQLEELRLFESAAILGIPDVYLQQVGGGEGQRLV